MVAVRIRKPKFIEQHKQNHAKGINVRCTVIALLSSYHDFWCAIAFGEGHSAGKTLLNHSGNTKIPQLILLVNRIVEYIFQFDVAVEHFPVMYSLQGSTNLFAKAEVAAKEKLEYLEGLAK